MQRIIESGICGVPFDWSDNKGDYVHFYGRENCETSKEFLERIARSVAKQRAFIDNDTGETKSAQSEQEDQQRAVEQHEKFMAEFEKSLAPMTLNNSARSFSIRENPVETAEDFKSVVEQFRRQTMTPDESTQENLKIQTASKKISETAQDRIEYKTARRDLRKLKRELDRLNKRDSDSLLIDAVNAEIEKLRPRVAEMREKLKESFSEINRIKQVESDKQREQNLSILKKAFPDRGGKSFFSQEFKSSVVKQFQKLGLERDAEYVFNALDIIGASYNTREYDRKPNEPTVRFGFLKRFQIDEAANKYIRDVSKTVPIPESYNKYNKSIELSSSEQYRKQLLNGLTRCLGRWIEQEILGKEQMKRNLRWLQDETGDYVLPEIGDPPHVISQDKAPDLCISPDGSSMTVESHLFPEDLRRRYVESPAYPCNVFSTGLEWLVAAPALFAEHSPKHFTQVLSNLEGLKNNKSR